MDNSDQKRCTLSVLYIPGWCAVSQRLIAVNESFGLFMIKNTSDPYKGNVLCWHTDP